MTLDEAIKHYEEKSEELRKTTVLWKGLADEKGLGLPSDYEPWLECAREYEQLVEWLKELKDFRAEEHRYELICSNKGIIVYKLKENEE